MEKHDLLRQIELKRAELVAIVSQKGLSSKATLQYSQELDKLLNLYSPRETLLKDKSLSY